MKAIYIRDDKAQIIYDATKEGIIWGHVLSAEGEKFRSQPVEQILARGYWEPIQ